MEAKTRIIDKLASVLKQRTPMPVGLCDNAATVTYRDCMYARRSLHATLVITLSPDACKCGHLLLTMAAQSVAYTASAPESRCLRHTLATLALAPNRCS